MVQVFIDGSEGTTGLRIHERLAQRQGIKLLTLSGEARKDPVARKAMIQQSDITFLCLPDAAAKESALLAQGSDAKVIDASTAHRVAAGWQYGFAELSQKHRSGIAHGSRVAVPGCHASGFIALVYPLISAGLLDRDALLSCSSLTGYSGGGKGMIADYENPDRDDALQAPRHYALGQAHKHLPEMVAVTGLHGAPVFSPIVAPYYAGMLVSIPIHAAQLTQTATPEQLLKVYADHYHDQPLISVVQEMAQEGFASAGVMAGKDSMQLTVAGNEQRLTLMARYDNLGKGASGAAIECMNLMLGVDETTGLVL